MFRGSFPLSQNVSKTLINRNLEGGQIQLKIYSDFRSKPTALSKKKLPSAFRVISYIWYIWFSDGTLKNYFLLINKTFVSTFIYSFYGFLICFISAVLFFYPWELLLQYNFIIPRYNLIPPGDRSRLNCRPALYFKVKLKHNIKESKKVGTTNSMVPKLEQNY